MLAHESAYEQLTLSIRENWLVIEGSVETLQQEGEIKALLLRLLRVCGVKSKLYVRSSSATGEPEQVQVETTGESSLGFIAELDC